MKQEGLGKCRIWPNEFFTPFRIILEAAYSLYDKAFFDNLSTILLMAVIGTAINFALIGGLLYLVHSIGAMGMITTTPNSHEEMTMTIFQILLFAALISAVDPVAVLAIFQEVHVNPQLYFLVFGMFVCMFISF